MEKRNAQWVTLLAIISFLLLHSASNHFPVLYYGQRYNPARKARGIERIPASWRGEWVSRDYILWTNPMREKGLHLGKEVKVKRFSIYLERDTYIRPGREERIVVEYDYKAPLGTNVQIKYYQGKNAREIGGVERDSLLGEWARNPDPKEFKTPWGRDN